MRPISASAVDFVSFVSIEIATAAGFGGAAAAGHATGSDYADNC